MGALVQLRGAGKGASGTTYMSGAVSSEEVPTEDVVVAPGVGPSGLPAGGWIIGQAPQKIIHCLGIAEWLAALTGQLANQTLVEHQVRGGGNKKVTNKYATAIAVGDLVIPAREGQQRSGLVPITFALHAGSGVTQIGEAIVETSDAGDPPAGTPDPLGFLVSAYRGASGTVEIATAIEARVRCQLAVKIGARNSYGLPSGAWVTGVRPQVVVRIEDADEYHTLRTEAVANEIVKLTFARAGGANQTLTCQIARRVQRGRLAAPPPEQSGEPGRYEVVWELVQGAGVTSVADMLALA